MNRQALVLAAHGSYVDPSVNRHVEFLAGRLQALSEFDTVAAAFHQGRPGFAEVLDVLDAQRIVVVPLMAGEGYYTDEVLPRELRKNHCFSRVEVHQTAPVGVHPRISELVSERIREIMVEQGLSPTTTSLMVVGHGTPRNARSRDSTLQLVDALRCMQLCSEIRPAFLDDDPSVEAVAAESSGMALLAIPFLMSSGPHAVQDLPRRMGMSAPIGQAPPFREKVKGRTLVCDQAVGMDSRMIQMLVELARTGANRQEIIQVRSRPRRDALRLGTRSSALALWQAGHVADRLRAAGVFVELVPLSTSGDRTLKVAIADLPSDAPFTDDIDLALRNRDIDLAVHSFKDLPLTLPNDLAIAAILSRGDATESLVSRDNSLLSELPWGSVIGTSSPRRAAQILALRPDLHPAPLRGAVDDRIRQVQRGDFAAAVLATAGLERIGRLDAAAERFSLECFMPAPGQAALAVTIRADDTVTRSIVETLEDASIRRAVESEIALLRPYEKSDEWVVGAFATVDPPDHRIVLRGRLLSRDGRIVHDVHVEALDPRQAAEKALESFRDRQILGDRGSPSRLPAIVR